MPSTVELDQLMHSWSPLWTDPPVFREGDIGRGVFSDLWDMVAAYQAQNPRPHLVRLNFEKVLGEMVALAVWATPSPFGNVLRAAVRDARLLSAFTFQGVDETTYDYRHLIINQLGFLLGLLAQHMRQQCRELDRSTAAVGGYADILQRLSDEYDVGIYNLNYDNLAISALPDAFTGFDQGKFDALAVASRSNWNFVYHLHGSVHYSIAGSTIPHSIVWKTDLSDGFQDSQALMASTAADFRPVIPTTLVAGGFKLDQLLAEPAQSLFASLVRHVHQADAFLIAGYGFADVHVNRALQNRFAGSSNSTRGRPPAVIVTKTDRHAGLVGGREGYEAFARELTQTLSTNFTSMQATPSPRFSLPELLDEGGFETDAFNRTHIWHSGFLESGAHLDQVVAALGRG